ncbi:Protein GZF3 [Nakaseomyces bracarensis]|uniref:Protein GZF3 n=1 Tax=Nakaseomyces bracarensis TaxID=273131 RepID=A0ABR4NS89_9SACH
MEVKSQMIKDDVEKCVDNSASMSAMSSNASVKAGPNSSTNTGVSNGNDGSTVSGGAEAEEYDPSAAPVCKNCLTSTTPLWRRDEHGAVLCNACGLFLKLHGKPRPISLKTDVIKSRSRKGSHMGEMAHERYKQSFTNFIPTSYEAYRDKKDHQLATTSNMDKKRSLTEIPPKIAETERKPSLTRSESDQSKRSKKIRKEDTNSGDQDSSSGIPTERTFQEGLQSGTDRNNPKRTAGVNNNEMRPEGITPMSPQAHSASITPLPRLSTVLGEINSEGKQKNSRNYEPTNENLVNNKKIRSSPLNQHNEFNSLENSLNEGKRNTTPRKGSQGSPGANIPIRDSRNSNTYSSKDKYVQPQPLDTSHLSHIPPNPHILSKGKLSPTDPLSGRRVSNSEINHLKGMDMPDYPASSTSDHNIPISVQLHNEEEVIRLRTRINELELVTDLYKRHIYELDERCKKLEMELKKIKR